MDERGLRVGVVRALYRYPVKSMRGEELAEAALGWHGLAGDRRFAFVRTGNLSSFPWLTAREVRDLLRYAPYFTDPRDPAASPVRVRTPDGDDLALEAEELGRVLAASHGGAVHLQQSNRGTFDSAVLSLIGTATVDALAEAAGCEPDPRRYRQNILLALDDPAPFAEEGRLGALLAFGPSLDAAQVRLDSRDPRCMMINLDPETAIQAPAVLRTVAQTRDGCAGVYCATVRPGTIRTGETVYLRHP